MSIATARISVLLAALLVLAGGWPLAAAERYDPRFRFTTIRTAHFDIHAHQGEEALARRLAAIAERVRQRFEPVFGQPRGRVQVILVDQTDLSNGWATPFPYNAIEITAVPPTPESIIGNTTDWLELVFTHEYTHILHLDRSRGFIQGVRRVFGRVPVVFPNAYLPQWQIEGIATFEESRMTGEGRVPAGDFRTLVDFAAVHGRFERLDRLAGGLSDWPDGNGAYAYGAYFHQYLAERYGPERLSRLADASSGRVPFFGAGSFKKVFGRSMGALWADFRETRASLVVAPSQTDTRATRLTHHGFIVTAPRAAADGAIYYATSNADRFPALMRVRPGATPQRVANRALGGRTTVRGEWVVFDQLERTRSVSLFSDLYAIRTTGGAVHRLTREARAADPDLSPDGNRIVCTIQMTGRRALGLLDFSPSAQQPVRLLVDDPDADFAGPRWSPDGRRIVVERRRGSGFELALVDPATRELTTLVARRNARLVTPSWAPDGGSILFAADPGDAPFNIFAVDAASGAVRQVTDTAGGAQFPEIAPDGSLIYVGYTVQGYDLFSVAYDASEQFGSLRADPDAAGEPRINEASTGPTPAASDNSDYSPLRTLTPSYWTPVVESDADEWLIGAGTATTDALGRHSYAASARWAARARPDWDIAYAYDRWRPTLFASYSDDTDPVRGGEVRSRELFTGALLRFRKVRLSNTFLAGFDALHDSLECTGGCGPGATTRDLRSIRGGWLFDSRRAFGYSISSEEGVALEVAAETSPQALGSDAQAGAAIVDMRGFTRVLGTHTVLAARAAFAGSWGTRNARRVFSAAGPGPSAPAFDFGSDAIGLLRGFAEEDAIGTRAAVINVDLRVPLARPQRGFRSWPVFLHSIHAAAFADAGHAWDNGGRIAELKTSMGGELAADLVVLHFVPLTIAGGAAWTRDGATDRSRGALFARIGYAF